MALRPAGAATALRKPELSFLLAIHLDRHEGIVQPLAPLGEFLSVHDVADLHRRGWSQGIDRSKLSLLLISLSALLLHPSVCLANSIVHDLPFRRSRIFAAPLLS